MEINGPYIMEIVSEEKALKYDHPFYYKSYSRGLGDRLRDKTGAV